MPDSHPLLVLFTCLFLADETREVAAFAPANTWGKRATFEPCCNITADSLQSGRLSSCVLFCPVFSDVISSGASCPDIDLGKEDATPLPEPTKVICAGLRGHVKSGTTWLGNLTASLMEHHCKSTGNCTYTVRRRYVVEELTPLSASSAPSIRWFESHEKHARPDFWPAKHNAIVILRDPREVVASLWHFNHRPVPVSYRHPSAGNLYFELRQAMDWIEFALQETLTPRTDTSLLLVKYASLIKDPQSVLEQMAHFLGLDAYGEILPQSLANAYVASDQAKVFTFREGKTCSFVKEFERDVMYHLDYWQGQSQLVTSVFPIDCGGEGSDQPKPPKTEL